MQREDYEAYIRCFNARDYDGVYDFFVPGADIEFFGIRIPNREALKKFYTFLHDYVDETIEVLAFASSDELVALEAIVHIYGKKDLDAETLEANGYGSLMPIKQGEHQQIKQYIHYRLQDGKFSGVGCAIPFA